MSRVIGDKTRSADSLRCFQNDFLGRFIVEYRQVCSAPTEQCFCEPAAPGLALRKFPQVPQVFLQGLVFTN